MSNIKAIVNVSVSYVEIMFNDHLVIVVLLKYLTCQNDFIHERSLLSIALRS